VTLRLRALGAERVALLALGSLARGLRREKAKPAHLLAGERGELEAMFYLRRQGYLIIERRWRTPDHNGDVDLIGWDGARLCFVEVKARTARDRTPAALAVDGAKQRMLRKMGRSFLRTMGREEREKIMPRFDVVSVYLLGETVECEVLQDAFPWRETNGARYGV
jgi:putative endonuclease